MPGSGKSYLARAIAARYAAIILDSDALRRVIYPEPEHSEREHRRLFPAIHVLIDRLLARGIPVIIDATNLKEANRRPYYKIAEKHGARVVLVQVTAPRRVIRERLRLRGAAGDPSTALPQRSRSSKTCSVTSNVSPGSMYAPTPPATSTRFWTESSPSCKARCVTPRITPLLLTSLPRSCC